MPLILAACVYTASAHAYVCSPTSRRSSTTAGSHSSSTSVSLARTRSHLSSSALPFLIAHAMMLTVYDRLMSPLA